MTLTALVAKYFATADDLGNAITTHISNVEAELIVDGSTYFDEVFAAASALSPGDEFFLVGWTFDAKFTRAASPKSIGQMLAEAQSSGSNIWVVLNGSQYLNHNAPGVGHNPFVKCLDACIFLRTLAVPAGSSSFPLETRALFDYAGPKTGSQHQKVVYIKKGSNHVAYVGGIDAFPDRDDNNAHSSATLNGSSWGWHDAVMRLRGEPVTTVMENLSSRWSETATLMPKRYWSKPPGVSAPSLKPFNPVSPASAPTLPVSPVASAPNPNIGIQVLRSRFPTKLPREKAPYEDWTGPPTGGIRQVYATLTKAIAAATRYIYLEDQFLNDSSYGGYYADMFSLFPHLVASLTANDVKLITLTSGRTDDDTSPDTGPFITNLVNKLPTAKQTNVSIWKLTDRMVHSKLWLIDDVFCSVGSANMHSRSMYGIDQELQVAVVDAQVDAQGRPAGVVRDWRVKLWAEHMDVLSSYSGFQSDIENLDLALGMWRKSWQIGGLPNTWRVSGQPAGFNPTRLRRTFVGPPPTEI